MICSKSITPANLPISTVIIASIRTAKSSLFPTHTKAKHYDRWVLGFIDLEAESYLKNELYMENPRAYVVVLAKQKL